MVINQNINPIIYNIITITTIKPQHPQQSLSLELLLFVLDADDAYVEDEFGFDPQ